jgi:ribonuclease III
VDALLAALQKRLGLNITDTALLARALTHRSAGAEHNERLEFLGDAVLGLVVTTALFRRYPDLAEGQLAKLRASVVNMRALAGVARDLRIGEHLLLGRGETTSGGADKSSILADTLEALIGAVYDEHGMDAASDFVHHLVDGLLDSAAGKGAGLDWKTSLQERTAELSVGVPEYEVSEEGPDHAKLFHAVVLVAGQPRGQGSGRSKKEAEQIAASAAYRVLATEFTDPRPGPSANGSRPAPS